ncbi:hypothetical protein F4558_003361 [Micromonospora profundi]|nr:hypothetical protein [Micromonospora profundi]
MSHQPDLRRLARHVSGRVWTVGAAPRRGLG